MILTDDIKPISYIKANAASILAQVNESHRPVFVTQNGEAKAVIMDAVSYQNLQNAIGLLKLISQGEKDIIEGKFTPQDEFFKSFEKKLKK
jgi:prevent-host-death family protein